MPEPRHLRNAPITEAIIDFRVKARPDFRAEEFGVLRKTLGSRLPRIEERRGGKIAFQFTPGRPQPAQFEDLGLQGLILKTEDQKTIAQFRTDGFTFNRLKPYTRWDELYPIAKDLWNYYVEIAKPQIVTRLALRYLNHVELPANVDDFDTYLRAAPPIPPELPQYLSAFLTRVTIHDPEAGVAAHISQALETGAGGRKIIVIVDIDAFKEGEFEPAAPEIDDAFGLLHNLKNRIFFHLLTDEALRLFQ